MKRALALAALCCAAVNGESLFNGRNLDGWYTWLRDSRYEDPKQVFTVHDGVIRISGEEWGGIATRREFRNYRLLVEWKWGGKTWGSREKSARDSGILVHAVGEDGAAGGTWLESLEAQIIEGGTGDIILVGGRNQPSCTAEVRREANGQIYWEKNAPAQVIPKGRINWFGRDPAWKDEIGYRGPKDVEKPVGEWNRQEVIADGDSITILLNGVTVNRATRCSHSSGKIQIQSEGAEILVRKVELMPLENSQKSSRSE